MKINIVRTLSLIILLCIIFCTPFCMTVFCDDPKLQQETYEKDIKTIIEKNIKKYGKGEFSIFVKELGSGLTCGYNEENIMKSASTIKLMMAGVIYELNNSGELELDSNITDPYTGKKYNLKAITHRMISHSVNDYFNILLRCIGKNRANIAAERIGACNTYMSNEIQPSALGVCYATNIKRYGTSKSPTTTAKDLGLFLELAYTNYFGEENSHLLIDSLLKNIYHDRIPMSISYKSKVAHKTGTCSGSVYNDAGIVYLDGNPYIIVILSENVSSSVLGTIRRISKEIYCYHEKHALHYKNIRPEKPDEYQNRYTPSIKERLKKGRMRPSEIPLATNL